VCDAGIQGNGDCLCTVTEKSAWMLGPFQPRYPGEPEYTNAAGSSMTCTECSPMYWGNGVIISVNLATLNFEYQEYQELQELGTTTTYH
jgi:hypothetical protein